MTDPRQTPSPPAVPEPSTAPEPSFDEPERPAPAVDDPPQRNTEF